MARVLNKYKDKIPSDAIYIGRPSPWGNPFKVDTRNGLLGSRDIVIKRFRQYAEDRLANNPNWLDQLKGKDLVCFCKPLACHGDVLLELLERGIDTHD